MKGFYKKIDNYSYSYGNRVEFPDGQILTAEAYANYEGEIRDGWYWFASNITAMAFFNIQEMPSPFDFETQ